MRVSVRWASVFTPWTGPALWMSTVFWMKHPENSLCPNIPYTNWNALDDDLPDVELPQEYWRELPRLTGDDFRRFDRKVAVLWRDNNVIIDHDLMVLLLAVDIFNGASSNYRDSGPWLQLELVLVGTGPGFAERSGQQ